ncbi:MAG: hypothetical protein BroJett038_17620 [Chloroflexota bacterium]|nr:MAG: hypothetical protein BroJett038_17620 [Chloroflexota bacterium]
MVKNVLIIVLVVAVFALAAVAFTQYNAGQESAALARDAQTAQAEVMAAQATDVSQAETAIAARIEAETGQGTAVAQADAAVETAAAAEAARATAVAQSRADAERLAERETALATAQTLIAAEAAAAAEGQAALATAQTLIAVQAADITLAGEQLATATAQVDLADFARIAAEADRAAALEDARLAATLLARAEATIAAMQPATPTPLPSPTLPPTETPLSAAATATPAPTAEPVVVDGIELDAVFVSADGTIRLNYPAGWLVQEAQGQIYMVNTPDALTTEGPQVQPGHFLVNILFGTASDLPGVSAGAAPLVFIGALADLINARAASGGQLGEPEAITIGTRDAARVEGPSANGRTVIIVLQMADDFYAVAFGSSAPDDLEQHEPTLRAILGTLVYSAP